MRQAYSREVWLKETIYCEGLLADPPWWWSSYLKMKERSCREDGFEDLADRINAVYKALSWGSGYAA